VVTPCAEMIEESRVENSTRGVTLCSQSELLREWPSEFTTQASIVPSLGLVYLHGTRLVDFTPFEMGIAFLREQVLFKPAEELFDMGLYELNVGLDELPEQDLPLGVGLIAKSPQEEELVVESEFVFSEPDKAATGLDRYGALTYVWRKEGKEQEQHIFVPKDTVILSSLRFFFFTRLSNPEIP